MAVYIGWDYLVLKCGILKLGLNDNAVGLTELDNTQRHEFNDCPTRCDFPYCCTVHIVLCFAA